MITDVRAHGKRLRFDVDPTDHIGKQLAARRVYERDLLEDIRARARSGIALDVGAHIGNHSVWLAAVCGMDVLAFEASAANRRALEANVALNHLAPKVRVLSAAAGARAGRCRTEAMREGNSGMTRIIDDPAGDVDVVAIDDLNLIGVSVIKIDVEGSEMAVLQGARATIERERPLLYIEAEGDRHEPVRRFMESLGYREFGCYAKTPTYGYAPARAQKPVVLSVAIMAHRKRAPFVEQLLAKLDMEPMVVWDERDNRWDTGRRSLLSYDPAATHHVVIQDDALIPQNLIRGIEQAVAAKPHVPISLYTGRQKPHGPAFIRMMRRADLLHASWLAWPEVCWGVGLVIPTDIISPMVAYADTQKQIANYDMRLSTYLRKEGMPMLYTVPSLVDHRAGAGNPSLVPGRTGPNRVAHRFIGEIADARALDWSGPIIVETRTRGMATMTCPVCGAADYQCEGAA